MKPILAILFSGCMLQMSRAELSLPPDISTAISKSSTGESGGLIIYGSGEKRFLDYICAHWREIADNIEYLPKSEPDEGIYFTQQAAINTSVKIFGAACEWLPPDEYVEFLNKLTDLMEQKRVDYEIWNSQLYGNAKKDYFLQVNWYHPKIKSFIARAKSLIPESDKDSIDSLDSIARGEQADSYLVNKSDNAPLPETLPGVKLERPFSSMIKKFERLTRKKVDVPYDPRFPDESQIRPDRRSGVDGGTAGQQEHTLSLIADHLWELLVIIGALGTAVASILKFRTKKIGADNRA